MNRPTGLSGDRGPNARKLVKMITRRSPFALGNGTASRATGCITDFVLASLWFQEYAGCPSVLVRPNYRLSKDLAY